jgi:hypothetical protein
MHQAIRRAGKHSEIKFSQAVSCLDQFCEMYISGEIKIHGLVWLLISNSHATIH